MSTDPAAEWAACCPKARKRIVDRLANWIHYGAEPETREHVKAVRAVLAMLSEAERTSRVAPELPPVHRPHCGRCDRCGWPLHRSVKDGCAYVEETGFFNCSQRPMPPKRSHCPGCGAPFIEEAGCGATAPTTGEGPKR